MKIIDTYSTKGDSIEFTTPTISGSFVKRDSDDEWERIGDEDDSAFTSDVKTKWFTSPLQTSSS